MTIIRIHAFKRTNFRTIARRSISWDQTRSTWENRLDRWQFIIVWSYL